MPKNRIHKSNNRYTYSATDKAGKRYSIASRKNETKAEFSIRCDDLDIRCGSDITVTTMTFGELHTMWMKDKYGDTESSDKNRMAQAYRYHVEPKIGHIPLLDISRPMIYQLLSNVRDKGYSDSVVAKARGTISRPYSWAFNTLKLNIPDPISNIRLTKRSVAYTENKNVGVMFYTQDEEKRFFSACKSKYYNYYRLLILTGLRPSEGIGLQWQDIDGEYLTINRAITEYGLGELKTKNAYRSIPITNDIKNVLDNINPTNEWLFPSNNGTPTLNAVTLSFNRAREQTAVWGKVGRAYKAKLITPPIKHTLYDFRHTFGTRMAERGMPDHLLCALMGHSDIGVTKKYYIGITDKMIIDARTFMENKLTTD